MKKLAFVVAAASLFAFAPLAGRFGHVGSSVALVWLGVLLALFASGTVNSLAIAAGAIGAFGSGVLGSVSPTVAGAVLVGAAFVERTTRVKSRTARAVHLGVAVVGGGLAGALSSAYTSASLSVFVVAAVVAAVLAALPLLVEADDPVAHALDQAAALVSEPARGFFRSGAELRRTAQDIPVDRATAARVTTSWESLLRLAEARIRLERVRPQDARQLAAVSDEPSTASPPSTADAVLGMVDQRISEHVSVLSRAYSAVDTVSAARLGLDDTSLKNVESIGDSLDEVSRALVEVRSEERATASR